MMVPCNWLMSCVRKMMTATPPVTPAKISTLCMRPSRRKRSATSSSKGIQRVEPLSAGRWLRDLRGVRALNMSGDALN